MLIRADARQLPLRDGCVQTCVTSPPYWGLRDYGTAQWDGGDPACDHAPPQRKARSDREDKYGFGTRSVLAAQDKGATTYRTECGKCCARRIDKQIGLEPTPDDYVQTMVQVFREVWRVLRDDGTLWLNLGDSYASQGGTGQNRHWDGRDKNTETQSYRRKPVGDVKSKDLVGIPWRVAFALQQPYYSGNIRSREDRIWLAAMLDAEGCMFIHKRKTGQNNGQGYQRQNDNYGPGLEISNTSERIVERCMEITGIGSICTQDGGRKQRLYRWNVRTTQSRALVRELYPHLVAKQQQARILYGCPSSGERAEAAHAALMSMHRTGASGVDFPAPPSCFEPGWYLRSDVIWSKLNPMPESVTDRPTKAHEYLFLLAKQERYYYDAAAIREEYAMSSWTSVSDAAGTTKRGQLGIRSGDKGAARAKGAADGTQYGNTSMLNAYGNGGRNKRSVWTVATQPYAEAHFATFPPALITPCILAGSRPGDLVLDPFIGSGTTGAVAEQCMRRWVGCDLTYQHLARTRTAQRGLRFLDTEAYSNG